MLASHTSSLRQKKSSDTRVRQSDQQVVLWYAQTRRKSRRRKTARTIRTTTTGNCTRSVVGKWGNWTRRLSSDQEDVCRFGSVQATTLIPRVARCLHVSYCVLPIVFEALDCHESWLDVIAVQNVLISSGRVGDKRGDEPEPRHALDTEPLLNSYPTAFSRLQPLLGSYPLSLKKQDYSLVFSSSPSKFTTF